MCSYFQQF